MKTITDQKIINKIRKAKTRRGKRILEKREPKLIEDPKCAVMFRCSTAKQKSVQLLKDLHSLKKPNSIYLNRKETWHPFDNFVSLEYLTKKNNSSLFAYVSDSKKRPNNLIIGRTFDDHLLDMFEFGFHDYLSLSDFHKSKISAGTKPIVLFCGDRFESDPDYQRLHSLLLDFFTGPHVKQINLTGLEHVINFIESNGRIFMRSYRIHLKKSGFRLPRVEIDEIGPRIDFDIRRKHLASEDLYRKALKQPKQQQQQSQKKNRSKDKNIEKDVFGSTLGQIHMERQDYNQLRLRKGGAFKVRIQSELQ
ncbi:ribosome production factor 2-like protein [Sarcoptes scabiei]|uniref:Ribosome production factor 2 homolog n=1 Tax=Sarcoptes scabiei TaxID=52283 RepID=A0A132A0F6_SARSC|nr:ribosome production factor 2-like protein [Sarcoptes scabiei]